MSASALYKSHVFLLSLDVNSLFAQLYEGFLGKLSAVATLEYVKSLESIGQRLSSQRPQAVLVTDGTITRHRDVLPVLLDYIREGGILILMGNFSSSVKPKDLDKLFQDIGLPWTNADYMRTTVHRTNVPDISSHASLLSTYSQKAVFLANVSIDDAWYLPNDSSYTQSLVFPSQQVQSLQQTPIAFTSVGNGKLGYVGDVNEEEGTDAVVLAMCRLGHVV